MTLLRQVRENIDLKSGRFESQNWLTCFLSGVKEVLIDAVFCGEPGPRQLGLGQRLTYQPRTVEIGSRVVIRLALSIQQRIGLGCQMRLYGIGR